MLSQPDSRGSLVSGGLGRGGTRAEIAEDIEKVYTRFPRLKERRRALSGLTSGGEQQMTAIGRALMSRPSLLVLDEPSMGLAPLVAQDIFRTLRQLNRERGSFDPCGGAELRRRSEICRSPHHSRKRRHGATGDAQDLRGRDDIKSFYLGKRAVAPSIPAVVG